MKKTIFEFTEEELNSMTVEELEALTTTAPPTTAVDMDNLLDFK